MKKEEPHKLKFAEKAMREGAVVPVMRSVEPAFNWPPGYLWLSAEAYDGGHPRASAGSEEVSGGS